MSNQYFSCQVFLLSSINLTCKVNLYRKYCLIHLLIVKIMLTPTPHNIILFELVFNIRFPLLHLLHFHSDLKSTIPRTLFSSFPSITFLLNYKSNFLNVLFHPLVFQLIINVICILCKTKIPSLYTFIFSRYVFLNPIFILRQQISRNLWD